MSGSNNSQLIIPHQTKDLNFTVPQTTVIPENTPVIENHENTHEIYSTTQQSNTRTKHVCSTRPTG